MPTPEKRPGSSSTRWSAPTSSDGPPHCDALAVIRQHHERFDGTGYPDGLAGEQISLAARIVAVVDVWDALTSDRAYRPAWPPDRALRHLEVGRGSHFDPTAWTPS